MVSFDCDIEGGVSFGCHVINVCFHGEEELKQLDVAVK